MTRCSTIGYIKSTQEVFRECIERFISGEGIKEKTNNMTRKGVGDVCQFNLPKVMSILEDDTWRLNRKVLEMYSVIKHEPPHNVHLDTYNLLKEGLVCYRIILNSNVGIDG